MADGDRLRQAMRLQSVQGKGQRIRMICKPDLSFLPVFPCLERKATLIMPDLCRFSLAQKFRICRTAEIQAEFQ
jgi:hypothetical protein